MADNVNHPAHYETGRFECIEVMIETQGVQATMDFCVCNALKYIYRHRMASYCQESTRYCNYGKDDFGSEITVIQPRFVKVGTDGWELWRDACAMAERFYFDLLDYGCTPQEARSVLPNSLKTEVVMTANMREWRHFIKLRTSPAAHPDMRVVAEMVYHTLLAAYPVFFEDIEVE